MRWLVLTLSLLAGAALAEMDADEYRAPGTLEDSAERQLIREAIEVERRAETAREAEHRIQEAAERERLERERAQRPYPVRLLEARCSPCHAHDALAAVRHARPGWYLVIWRMRLLNGAAISHAETLALSAHLTKTQPPGQGRLLAEYAAMLFLPLGAAATYLAWRRWRSRKP